MIDVSVVTLWIVRDGDMCEKPLVIGSDEAFPVHSQDPVSDVQPAVRSGWSFRDQCTDVDPR